MPQVSVVIPAYNAGRTIGDALRSVFWQTYRDFEVIVVDDGSTDDTQAVVNAWPDPVVYQYQPNGGPGRARNTGVSLARGRLIAFLDADDVWLPRKLERQMGYFAAHPETGMLHSAVRVSRTPFETILDSPDAVIVEETGTPPSHQFSAVFHGDVTVNTLTVMVRRDVFLEVGQFDERREVYVEDWDCWLRIAARYPIGFLSMPLAIHRPGGLMSAAVERTYLGQQVILEKIAPLCARACARHRGDPRRCIDERRHLLYWELGHERFRQGRMRQARDAFRASLKLRPNDIRTWSYYAASFLGQRGIDQLRRLRRSNSKRDRSSSAPERATVNLFRDTAYRRTRQAVVDRIHSLDDAIHRLRRTESRILFEAASPMSLAVFRPVLDQLRRDPRLEFWFTTCDASWDASSIFSSSGIRDHVLAPEDVRRMKFDAYVNTDFWNMTWLPRRTKRVHMFHGVAGKYRLDAPMHIAPVVATFDRLMFPNRDRLRRYAEAGLVNAESPQSALIGYPKVDCLVDGTLDRRRIERALGLDVNRPTVLYAPTWSPYSSLTTMGAEVIRALARLDVNVVVKLHDRSYDASLRASGGINWREHLEPICHAGGVHLAEEADASPYLFISDVLVTDHSSVGFEYMLLDRPVVSIACPLLVEKARISAHKVDLLRKCADIALTVEQVVHAVHLGLREPARRSVERRQVAEELFYCPGGATARAVICIYDVLELPLPESEVARRTAVMSSPVTSLGTSP